MKLVFKIAAGILLAGMIGWGVRIATLSYVGKQATESMQTSLKNLQQHQLKAQQERQRQQAERLAREQAAKAEQQRQRQLAYQEKARKDAAFRKWWQSPTSCNNPVGMQELVECADLKTTKRKEFEKLWAQGQLH